MSCFVVLAIGNNLAFMVSTVLIQKHFTTNRGFGGSCSTVGYSIGHLTAPTIVTFLIQKYGWRGSALIMAAVLAHIAVFGALYREPENRRGNLAGAAGQDNRRDPESAGIRNPDASEAKNRSNAPTGDQNIADGMKQTNELASDCDEETNENARCLPESGQHRVDPGVNGMADRRRGDDSARRDDERQTRIKEGTTNGVLDRGRSRNKLRSFIDDAFDCSLYREFGLVLYCVCSMLSRYNMCVFLQHMPRKAVQLGISKEEVALLMSALGIAIICCRVLVTLIADRKWINRMVLYGCGVAIGGLGSYLTLIHSFAGFLASSVVHGIHIGRYCYCRLPLPFSIETRSHYASFRLSNVGDHSAYLS